MIFNMCLIIIKNKFSITKTEQEKVNHISSCIRRISFQNHSYQKIRCSWWLTAEIRAWLLERRSSNESSSKETTTAHESFMMKSLVAADESDNRININHSLSSYFVSNSNDSIVEVSTELLWMSVRNITF